MSNVDRFVELTSSVSAMREDLATLPMAPEYSMIWKERQGKMIEDLKSLEKTYAASRDWDEDRLDRLTQRVEDWQEFRNQPEKKRLRSPITKESISNRLAALRSETKRKQNPFRRLFSR